MLPHANVLRFAVTTISAAAVALSATPSAAATPTCFGEKATIVGTSDADTIHGTEGPDVIVSGNGPDTVYGEGGDDLICGGPGNDVIDDGAGQDRAFGDTGDDTFISGRGDDELVGGPHSERCCGNAVSYATSPRPVHVDLAADRATGDGTDQVKHIWTATGSPFNDWLIGTKRRDHLFGGCGDDRLFGRDGNDSLSGDGGPGECTTTDSDLIRGGDGNNHFRGAEQSDPGTDTLLGGLGRDFLRSHGGRDNFSGDRGVDTFDGAELSQGLFVDLARGKYRVGDNSGTLSGVDVVGGTVHGDQLLGGPSDDRLLSASGPDVLRGRGGDDYLDAEPRGRDRSHDVAYGGPGRDVCIADRRHGCESSSRRSLS